MRAVVVYESLRGNTAAIARAVAEGIRPDARAVPTDETTASTRNEPGAPPADLGHPSMRAWLATLPQDHGRSAAFETRIWWSPGSSVGAIGKALEHAGYPPAAKAQRFVVRGRCGPPRDGELERARRRGAELARAVGWGPRSPEVRA